MSSMYVDPNSSSCRLSLAQLDIDLIEHVLSAQCFGDAFRFMFSQGMIGVDAGYFKNALVQLDHSERTKRHSGRHLNVVHIVNLKMAMLFDPVFDKRIAQSMFGLTLRQV